MARSASKWWAVVLSAAVLVGCGRDELQADEEASQVGSAEATDAIQPARLPEAVDDSAMPTFIDGRLRCELGQRDSGLKVPARATGGAQAPAPAIRATAQEVPCSGPTPWCRVFGPSETDRENHRLRAELGAMRRKHDEQAARLRARLDRAEEKAARERWDSLGKLRKYRASESIYLTNDESMSLASPQRLIRAIERGDAIFAEQVRPHELLNYFTFETLPLNPGEVFSVLPELSPHPVRPSDLTLGFSVKSRDLSRATRRNVNLTYVLDRSGSMGGEGRLSQLKTGVVRSLAELKDGDIVSVVLFDTTTCPLAQNFVVGRDSLSQLKALIEDIEPRGGSNLADGLGRGYAMANQAYRPDYSNRVVLVTDADAAGVAVREELLALTVRSYDTRRIRLSAVGLGETVNDRLLDRLTEAGKGASVFVSSPVELEAIFGSRFSSLVETVATNVHFRLELPSAVSLRAFYGEEASTLKSRVQAVHFFSGTAQMYLANLQKTRTLLPTDMIRLTIQFDDPVTGEPRESEFSWRADELEMATGERSRFASRNLNKARMVATFGYQLKYMAGEFAHLQLPERVPTWTLPGAAPASARERSARALRHCRRVKGRLDAFAAQLEGAREAVYIAELWHRYCQRFPGDELPPPASLEQAKLVQLSPTPLGEEEHQASNDFAPGLDDF